MTKLNRLVIDILIACYSLFAMYYIILLIDDFYHAFFPPYDSSFLTVQYVRFIIIYGIVFGVHIILSIWMYADFAKRNFKSNSARAFWLAMLTAGLAPLYYFVIGRLPWK